MLYATTSKEKPKIANYISLYARYFEVSAIFQCNNCREFQFALLIFLKKHKIKLINSRLQTPHIQELIEQSNIVVKNYITE